MHLFTLMNLFSNVSVYAFIYRHISGGLGRGPVQFGPAWAGFLLTHQGPEAHFGPNLAFKIGLGLKSEAHWVKMGRKICYTQFEL